jgi:hypothetical protein
VGFGLSLVVEVIGGIVTAFVLGLGAAGFAASQRVRTHDGRIEDLYEDNRRWFRDRDRDLGTAKDQLAEQAADRGLIGGGALRQGSKKKQRQALHDYRDEISAKRRRYRELREAEGQAEELVRRRTGRMRRFELSGSERAILAAWRTGLDPPGAPGAVEDPTSAELEPDLRRFEEHGDPARHT